jgi:hypothetical protein
MARAGWREALAASCYYIRRRSLLAWPSMALVRQRHLHAALAPWASARLLTALPCLRPSALRPSALCAAALCPLPCCPLPSTLCPLPCCPRRRRRGGQRSWKLGTASGPGNGSKGTYSTQYVLCSRSLQAALLQTSRRPAARRPGHDDVAPPAGRPLIGMRLRPSAERSRRIVPAATLPLSCLLSRASVVAAAPGFAPRPLVARPVARTRLLAACLSAGLDEPHACVSTRCRSEPPGCAQVVQVPA